MTEPALILKKSEKRLAPTVCGVVFLPILLAAGYAISVLLFFRTPAAILFGIPLTGLLLSAAYYGLETYLLPYLRVRRLYRNMDLGDASVVEGIYRGEDKAQALRDQVRMRVFRVDAGQRVRTEPVETEVFLPAVFTGSLLADQNVRFLCHAGVISAIEPGPKLSVRLKRGSYEPLRAAYYGIAILVIAFWMTAWFSFQAQGQKANTEIAVCTLAYHPESEAVLSQKANENGLKFQYAYTTTLETEQLTQYLSTYAVNDAELILVPESLYYSVLDRDTPPFSLGTVPDGARTVQNETGSTVAVVLFDPENADSPGSYPSILNWIAVPAHEPILLCIGPGANETADSAASTLLSVLSADIFPKE